MRGLTLHEIFQKFTDESKKITMDIFLEILSITKHFLIVFRQESDVSEKLSEN